MPQYKILFLNIKTKLKDYDRENPVTKEIAFSNWLKRRGSVFKLPNGKYGIKKNFK